MILPKYKCVQKILSRPVKYQISDVSVHLVVLSPAAEHVPRLLAGAGARAGAVEAGVPLAHAVNVAGAVFRSQDC